jgi:two-component system, cell cycle sensor histidine kinase and response regulator CckA
VYGFAKQSRGHVKIYSEVGHGTTVRLYLPQAAAKAEPARDIVSEAKFEPHEATILVVEDNANVRNIAVQQLSDLGYKVVEAPSAEAALSILKQDQRIDILFTDVIMPGSMTGDVLASEARKLRPNLGILFTSGFADASIQNGSRLPNLAGHGLLSKPYRKQDLARRIRETLQARRETS